MLEPADSQEAYDFTLRAIEISERWQLPVLLRMTTRVCHSKTIMRRGTVKIAAPHTPHFEHDFASRVMIPAYAKPAHLRLRKRLAEIAAWNDEAGPNQLIQGSSSLGIITSGVAFQYVREAAPEVSVLKLGLTYPLPVAVSYTHLDVYKRQGRSLPTTIVDLTLEEGRWEILREGAVATHEIVMALQRQ